MSGIPMDSSNACEPELNMQRSTPMVKNAWLRRVLFFCLVLVTSAQGSSIMLDILLPNGLNLLEIALLVLFSITFLWIVFSFWSGVIGFVLQLLNRDPITLKSIQRAPASDAISARTAVVMPIYNEDTARVIAGVEASVRSLEQTGQMEHFDFYLLSDTQDPAVAKAELAAWHEFTARFQHLKGQLFYRRREINSGRKVGNLADFCQRWGGRYEGMIVMDADSVLTGECMLSLVRALQANASAGLIQTVPIPVRQETFFGRFVQFAAVLYSPMLATGLAFWQIDSANYWGHNAIIRVQPFLKHCGLPPLPGKAPFGGEILSHDFVEAALLRRAGWDVVLMPGIEGSYEEVPSNILDYATRDRRWVQGNIQHLALLRGAGLHRLNRLYFLLGALAYVSSLLWLIMLGLSSIDAVARALSSNIFFQETYQLFPDWRIAKIGLIFSLLYVTAALLLLPKLMGNILALVYRRAEFGGAWRLFWGTLLETVFAILIAPLMMVFHAYFVVCVFLGKQVNWNAQVREGRMVPWREAFRHTAAATAIAICWGGLMFYFSPSFFWWLMPVLVGLILAAPIVRYSSSLSLGRWAQRHGMFLCPSETETPLVLQDVAQCLNNRERPPAEAPLEVTAESAALPPSMPPDQWQEMPIQSFKKYSST